MRAITIGIFLLLLSGCSSLKEPGSLYANLPQASLIPKSGMAQLVFYYPHSWFWSDIANIELNGKKACDLESGSFFIRDIEPSAKTTIAVSPCGLLGTSRLTLKTEANKKYYIRITPVDNTLTGQIARYNLSEPVPEPLPTTPLPTTSSKDVPASSGPFSIGILDEPFALKELRSLRACTRCSNAAE